MRRKLPEDSGALTLLVWGLRVVAAAVGGEPADRLDSYATDVTYALDLGIITSAALTAGAMILRRVPVGYVLALSLLVLEAMLAPLIAAQTVSQLAAGVTFTPAEVAGPIAGSRDTCDRGWCRSAWAGRLVQRRHAGQPRQAERRGDPSAAPDAGRGSADGDVSYAVGRHRVHGALLRARAVPGVGQTRQHLGVAADRHQ
jgi:hypothetical protein